jgi:hypothetical protein
MTALMNKFESPTGFYPAGFFLTAERDLDFQNGEADSGGGDGNGVEEDRHQRRGRYALGRPFLPFLMKPGKIFSIF